MRVIFTAMRQITHHFVINDVIIGDIIMPKKKKMLRMNKIHFLNTLKNLSIKNPFRYGFITYAIDFETVWFSVMTGNTSTITAWLYAF